MDIHQLICDIKTLRQAGHADPQVSGISFDSRVSQAGHLFVAVKGYETDGHIYIPKAIENGAKHIICENLPESLTDGVAYYVVEDSSEALGKIASAYYGHPSENLVVTGVTGTNGKTSTATLLYHLFRRLGKKCGLLSTVCNYIEGEERSSSHTTPDPIEMNRLMAEMVDKGCQYVFMEVSSHSVVQKRIAGIQFDGAVFTNVTRDHIDYHKTMEAYIKAKKAFFDGLPEGSFALTNLDDKNGLFMLQNTKAKKYGYSLQTMADFRAKVLEESMEGMLLEINGKEVYLMFTGRFNAYNLLAVYGAATLLGMDSDEVLQAMTLLHPVSGRFDTIHCKGGFTAIVDYAHTPDAIENVLETINDIRASLPGQPRIITLAGCGGNRDKGKRPEMAKIATRLSDLVILTSDNPRNEDPDAIIQDMVAGIDASCQNKYLCITDRRQAIRTACKMAQKGDIVLVAGKGHEDYQIIGNTKTHFNDKEEILLAQD